MSTRMNWSVGNFTPENPYEMNLEDTFDSFTKCLGEAGPSVYQVTDLFLPSPPMSSDPIMVHTNLEGNLNPFQDSVPNEQLGSPFMMEPSVDPWAYGSNTALDVCMLPDSWSANRVPPTSFLVDPANNFPAFDSPRASHESDEFSLESLDLLRALGGMPYLDCSCYKQAIGELLRSGIKSHPSGITSIDSTLARQKELLLQAEAILQCKVCSQSEAQANMFMVIIVTIDSLLTSFEGAATATKAGAQPKVFTVGVQEERTNQKPVVGCFRSHIEACPLLVGGFRVPMEEKICFVRQMLQARLSMLLMVIRRISVCMQQHLASALSRGRVLMIMETDRRLQLIMMKVKIAMA